MKNKLWLIIVIAACSRAETASESALCEDARVIATLPREINEASGIAASLRTPGIFWVHNDDDPIILFAIDSTATLRGRVRVPGLSKLDFEDIAAAPCGNESCLFLADIGNNKQKRSERAVYRIPEPAINDTVAAPAVRFPFRMPDRQHDAEGVFVLPGERVFVVSKGRGGPITIYAFPDSLVPDRESQLQPLVTLTEGLVQFPEMVTGAAATPDGKHVALRSYSGLQLYRIDGQKFMPAGGKFSLQQLAEPQGEGVTIRSDGVVFLVSEKGLEGKSAPLSRVQCKLSD